MGHVPTDVSLTSALHSMRSIEHLTGWLVALQAAALAPGRASRLVMLGTAYPMKVSPALLATSRDDPLRAIDMVCEYLERTEPTNPAQLLLRRARKLVNKNFVELVRELAPESLNEVARVMGISAEELSALQGQE